MLKLSGIFVSLFLIVIIFLRIPQDNVGLASSTINSNLGGSPRSVKQFLNILTVVGILIYFGIAIQLTLTNN